MRALRASCSGWAPNPAAARNTRTAMCMKTMIAESGRLAAHLSYAILTALIGILVHRLPLRSIERGVAAVVMLQGFAHHECAGVGDGALGNQAAPQRNLAHQLTCQCAPSEGAARNRENRPDLVGKACFAAARRGK